MYIMHNVSVKHKTYLIILIITNRVQINEYDLYQLENISEVGYRALHTGCIVEV